MRIGRYTFFGELASGGMATVYLGRMSGQAGFTKTVAIKRPHPHLAKNPELARMIVDEARVAARIQHPNVVAMVDCVATNGELFLVMDYIHGESLWHLLAAAAQRGVYVPPSVIGSIIVNVLHGLHAAHEATDEIGHPLGIVHRDVSPQNVLVGVDGVARVLDFGVAKANDRLQSTQEGQLKGKFAYMAPEQVSGAPIDRRTDIYAAAALLWGGLAGRRLIEGRSEAELLNNVLQGAHYPPSAFAPNITPQMDDVVMRGLARHPEHRFQTAREMAVAVEQVFGTVSPYEVGEWVKSLAAETIAVRSQRIREMESASDVRVSMNEGVAEIVSHPNDSYAVHHYPPTGAHPQVMLAPTQLGPPQGFSSQTPPPPYHVPMTTPGIYVSAGAQAEPRRSMATLVGVAALVFAVTFGGTLYWRYGGNAVANDTPPPVATTVTPQPPPPPIATAIATQPPVATATATATATTITSAAAAPSTSASAKPGKKLGGGNGTKKSCETSPFYVDSDGIKQVRPECM